MSRAILYRLLIYGLLTLMSVTAFFRLIIVAIAIAGFTGIIIAIVTVARSYSNNNKNMPDKNQKSSSFIEGNYTLVDEDESMHKKPD